MNKKVPTANDESKSNGCLGWRETIKVSLILGFLTVLASELLVNDLLNIPTPMTYHIFIFIGSTIISVISFRLGWLHKQRDLE